MFHVHDIRSDLAVSHRSRFIIHSEHDHLILSVLVHFFHIQMNCDTLHDNDKHWQLSRTNQPHSMADVVRFHCPHPHNLYVSTTCRRLLATSCLRAIVKVSSRLPGSQWMRGRMLTCCLSVPHLHFHPDLHSACTSVSIAFHVCQLIDLRTTFDNIPSPFLLLPSILKTSFCTAYNTSCMASGATSLHALTIGLLVITS